MTDGSILSDDERADGVTLLAGRGRRRRREDDGRPRQAESGEEGGDEDSRVGGHPGDGKGTRRQQQRRRGTRGGLFGRRPGRRGGRRRLRGEGLPPLGLRRRASAGHVTFFSTQLSTRACRRAGIRRPDVGCGIRGRAYDDAGGRTVTGAEYKGGRTTTRAYVRRRVGIPIPDVK